MADGIFDIVATALEESSTLDKLEARGTLRIALKQAGLGAKTVTATEMEAVLEKVLPAQLEARGIDRAQALCGGLQRLLAGTATEAQPSGESPEDVFRRLGRR